MGPETRADSVAVAHAFAARELSDGQRLDTDDDALAAAYARFADEGLHAVGGCRIGLTPVEIYRWMSAFAEYSGAFAFLVFQQWIANNHLYLPDDRPWPKAGVAFGQLRNVGNPAPTLVDGLATGPVPWFTGSGIFESALLGVRVSGDREAFVWTSARDRPEFRHSPPYRMLAATSTRTVRVEVRGLPIGENELFLVRGAGAIGDSDSAGAVWQTPLMVGCMRAAVRLLREAPSRRVGPVSRVEARLDALVYRLERAIERGCDAVQATELRAEAGDLAVRLARLAVMGVGGMGLTETSSAQRLYREALMFNLVGQNDQIVRAAFDGLFL
ncbi:MAG: acyl-CoA dehydrogenase family protein [Fimbriimonadaceae bacterium]